MNFRNVLNLALALLILTAANAYAGYSWHATNINGNQAPPPYGLRLDGFFTGSASDEVTFSFDNVWFHEYDDNTAELVGDISVAEFNNTGGPGAYASDWMLNVQFERLTSAADLANIDPGHWDPSWRYYKIVDNGMELVNKADANDNATLWTYPFDLTKPFQVGDGANGKNNNFGASGWLNWEHYLADGTTIGDVDRHYTSSDFLMDLNPIPEPSTIMLFGLGLIPVGLSLRRFMG